MNVRMRWWMWLVLAMLIICSAVVCIHLHGTMRFTESQAELKRLGYVTTMEEMVAAGPTVDRDRQTQIRPYVFQRSGGTWIEDISHALPFNELREQRFPIKDLSKRDQALRDGARDLAAVEAIIAQGPVEISLFGLCERDPAKLRTIDIHEAAAIPLPNLMSVRAYANAWAIRACLDSDPEPALRNLDRLVTSMHHPGTLIDAMISIACSAIRDQAHLWLACRDRLPEARLRTWAAEMPLQRAWCAAGYAGERCCYQEPLSRMRSDFGSVSGSSTGFMQNAVWFLIIWPTQGHEAAYGCSVLAATEAELLDRPRPPAHPMPFGYRGFINAIALPNLIESGVTATEAANRHRMLRCAALTAAVYRRAGSLPEAMPDGAPSSAINANLPAYLYERLAPSRFRVGVDPTGPRPPTIPSDRWTVKGYGSDIGKPPSPRADTLRQAGRWSVEIDLDAILVPPPEKSEKTKSP